MVTDHQSAKQLLQCSDPAEAETFTKAQTFIKASKRSAFKLANGTNAQHANNVTAQHLGRTTFDCTFQDEIYA